MRAGCEHSALFYVIRSKKGWAARDSIHIASVVGLLTVSTSLPAAGFCATSSLTLLLWNYPAHRGEPGTSSARFPPPYVPPALRPCRYRIGETGTLSPLSLLWQGTFVFSALRRNQGTRFIFRWAHLWESNIGCKLAHNNEGSCPTCETCSKSRSRC